MVKIGPPSMSETFKPPKKPSWEISNIALGIIEEYFNGDWRNGEEICKVVITQRLYQTSHNSTQA